MAQQPGKKLETMLIKLNSLQDFSFYVDTWGRSNGLTFERRCRLWSCPSSNQQVAPNIINVWQVRCRSAANRSPACSRTRNWLSSAESKMRRWGRKGLTLTQCQSHIPQRCAVHSSKAEWLDTVKKVLLPSTVTSRWNKHICLLLASEKCNHCQDLISKQSHSNVCIVKLKSSWN